MFEYQFRHEAVGLETKFFRLPLAQQISFISSTSFINLGDKEPIVKLARQYITILLQFVLPSLSVFHKSCSKVALYH